MGIKTSLGQRRMELEVEVSQNQIIEAQWVRHNELAPNLLGVSKLVENFEQGHGYICVLESTSEDLYGVCSGGTGLHGEECKRDQVGWVQERVGKVVRLAGGCLRDGQRQR